MIKAIREAVGTRADILFGTHGQFTASGALRMARAIEPYDPLWFEEPVPPDMPEVMAQVARGTSIPIATGERLTTKFEFARVIENRAATILQPDLGRSGGILETKKIAAMAEAYHIQIAPHCYCGPIVGAANIQLAVTLPNFLILESLKQWDGFHATLLKKKIEWQDGNVIPSKEPGLGRRIERSRLRGASLERQGASPADDADAADAVSSDPTPSSASAISAAISPRACCAGFRRHRLRSRSGAVARLVASAQPPPLRPPKQPPAPATPSPACPRPPSAKPC